MFLVPELKGLVGSFIHSDMALLILRPSSYLSVAYCCTRVSSSLGGRLRSLHNIALHNMNVL